MRRLLVVVSLLLGLAAPASAQVSINFGGAGLSIGLNVPTYPRLVRVPGYPVYYDAHASSNYFFYDGYYWVFHDDRWFASSWYDGPWQSVAPDEVPLWVLRVPVRYYRRPPADFRGWRRDAAPRWGERWGRDWEQHRPGWNRWSRRDVPRAAPLPSYQRSYAGQHYPRDLEAQRTLRAKHYSHRPREVTDARDHPGDGPRRDRVNERAAPDRGKEHGRRRGQEHEKKDHGQDRR